MAKSNFIVRGGANFSSINKALTQTQKQFTGFQSTISKSMKIVGAALGGIVVTKFIKDSTSMAMGVESSMDNITRNMGNSANVFQQWANTQSKYLGIAKSEAYSYGSTFSNLLGSFQSDTKETADSTQELMKASAIIASKTGRTYDDVANRIRSGMLGSTEAIEDLGVYTNISMIESTNAFKKFANGKSWAQLDFKVQQQIRLAAILEQTYSRYGDTLANTTQSKQAMFLASLKNIQLNIGQVFLPIYNVALPALTTLGNALELITGKLAVLSETFFGKSISIQASGIEEGTTAISDQGDAIEKAGKQAKKAITSIDEINQLSSGSSSSGGSGGSSIGTNPTAPTVSTTVTDVDTGFTKWLEKIKDVIKPTEEALGRLKNALKPLGDLVFDNIKSFYSDTLVPIGKWILGEGLPRLLDVGSGLLNSINWNSLSTSLANLSKAIAPFAISVGNGLIIFIETLADIMKPALTKTADLLAKSLNAIATVIKLIPEDVAIAIGGAIGGLATSILLFNGATTALTTINGLKTSIPAMLQSITKHPVLTIVAGLGALAGAVLALSQAKFNKSEVGTYIGKIKDLTTESKKLNEESAKLIKTLEDKRESIESEYGSISLLSDKYFELTDQTELTNDQQLLMKTYADELVKKIPELSGLIDTQTGAYKGTKEEIESLITKTKEYYLVQAAQESLIEIAQKQYEAEKNLKELQSERETILKTIAEKQEEYNSKLGTGNLRLSTASTEQKQATIEAKALSGQILVLKEQQDALNTQIDDGTTSLGKLSDEWDYATDYILEYSGANETTKKAIDDVKKSVQNTTSTITKEDIPGHARKSIDGFNDYFIKDSSTNTAITNWLKGVNSTISSWKVPDIKVAFSVTTSAINEALKGYGMYNFNMPNPNVNAYATGGFPSAGELFIANEAGPELVGKMGSSSVVANNNQIVDGIKAGVTEGIVDALIPFLMNTGSNGGDIVVENTWMTSDEKLYQSTQRGRLKSERRFQTVNQY